MSAFTQITDPTDLDAIRAAIETTPDAADLVPLGISTLVISPEASLGIVDAVTALIGEAAGSRRARVVVLGDETLIRRNGEDLKRRIGELLARSFEVQTVRLGHDGALHADEVALDSATDRKSVV